MRIYNNIPALQAYNALSVTTSALQKSIQKLSTGLRINSAADDAAGLAISEKMRAQIRGLDRAAMNAQDGISMIQTAEGALQETTSILQRMRELSVQAANDTLTQQDRGYIQLEIDQLREEINRIANTTQFNKKKLLDGSASVLWSSDNLDTKLFVRGGLRQIDQFGQKSVAEGNYKVTINANPGTAQVQKTDLFKIKHQNVISDLRMSDDIAGVKVDNLPAGDYTIGGSALLRSVSAGTWLENQTWFAAGTVFTAGTMFAAGSTFSAGTLFTGAQNFGAGATFSLTAAVAFGAGTIFAAGTKFSAGVQINSGAVFSDNTLITTSFGTRLGEGTVLQRGTTTITLSAALTQAEIAGLVRDGSNVWSGTLTAGNITILKGVVLTATHTISAGVANANGGAVTFRTVAAVGAATTFLASQDTTVAAANYKRDSITLGGNGSLSAATAATNYAILVNAYTDNRGQALRASGNHTSVYAMQRDQFPAANAIYRQISQDFADLNDDGLVQIYASGAPAQIDVYQVFGLDDVTLNNRYGLGLNMDELNGFSGTANILLEVKNVDLVSNIVTFRAVAQVLFADGTSQSFVADDMQIKEGLGVKWTAFGVGGEIFSLDAGAITAVGYSVGDKLTIGAVSLLGSRDGTIVTVSGTQNQQWAASWASGYQDMKYWLNSGIAGKDVHMRAFYINTMNGQVYESNISLSFINDYTSPPASGGAIELATFKSTYIGQTARLDTQLRDLDKFWDANGVFLLEDPQTITVTQGDGRRTSITLYATDTIKDLEDKFNSAIANGLGQALYLDNALTNDAGRFASYVLNGTANTHESVDGTMVIRSIVNGSAGTISFAGDENLIKALSLNTIQQAKENQFYVSIQDAHTGQPVASNVKITGNVAIGILHPNLDFEFSSHANMSTVWNDIGKRYDTKAIDTAYETIIHVADNSAVFQIGANEGEDMGIDIADMSSRALGVHKVLVTDQKSAARSITIIDGALDRVAKQRASLGAYQNRLEHTINNLTVAAENLTASESRIRDLDMAKEMMNFTKLNILMQAGNSMLGQANMLPQNVLALLR